MTKSEIIHQEIIELDARSAQIKQFIMTPERILDYYPSPVEGGVLKQDKLIYCRGKSNASMLELLISESTKDKLVLKVTVSNDIKPPFTKFKFEKKPFFTMIEDWQLHEENGITTLTKTWRKLKKYKLRFLPLKLIIRLSAKAESKKLVLAWNQAAADHSPADNSTPDISKPNHQTKQANN